MIPKLIKAYLSLKRNIGSIKERKHYKKNACTFTSARLLVYRQQDTPSGSF